MANKIKEYRKLKNMTQDELGQRMNVSRTAIANWENGIFNITSVDLLRLSDILEVSIDELLDNTKFIAQQKITKNELISELESVLEKYK